MNRKSIKTAAVLLAAILIFSLLAGCGSKAAASSAAADASAAVSQSASVSQSAASAETSASQSASASSSEQTSGYPVTVTTYAYDGSEIQQTFDKAPERVVCVYQCSIENMIALGLEDHVIASYGLDNDVKDEWKDGLSKMHYDDSVFAPDKETVVALQPDMILSWGSLFSEKNLGDYADWNGRGCNIYIDTNTRRSQEGQTMNRTVENECTDLLNLGKIFGVEDKAQELVDEMTKKIDDTVAAVKSAGTAAPTVAVVEFGDDYTANYGAAELAGDMVTKLGGQLSMPDQDDFSNEDLISADPDVIFVVYMEKNTPADEVTAKVTDNAAFASLSAVKNSRVYPIMLGDMYASGVRTIDGINTIAAGLYPDLSK
jgi:iron complex transport system substrate-binding protein